MTMNSIKKNFAYNLIYNILTILIPLITVPYISRVLGPTQVGRYSYASTVSSYFGMFILLGLANYGNRTIAMIKQDDKLIQKTFWDIYYMQLLMSAVVLSAYVLYIVFLADDREMAILLLVSFAGTCIDISWFYFGMEQFGKTVSSSLAVKFINLILILTLVKTKNDIYIYTVIMCACTVVNQLILWHRARKVIGVRKIDFRATASHFKPNLILFIPVIAVSLYTMMDKVMLGQMTNMKELGFYENSFKVIQIPSLFVTALGTVMLPRVTSMITDSNIEGVEHYFKESLLFAISTSSAMAFSLCGICDVFVPLFFGKGYEPCIGIIEILMVASIFMSCANVVRTQYLIPQKMDGIFIKSSFCGAIVNCVVNLLLIPKCQAVGAAIGTLLAEAVVCIYQVISIKEESKVIQYIKRAFPIVAVTIVEGIILTRIKYNFSLIVSLMFKVLSGFAILALLLVLMFIILKKEYKGELSAIKRLLFRRSKK